MVTIPKALNWKESVREESMIRLPESLLIEFAVREFNVREPTVWESNVRSLMLEIPLSECLLLETAVWVYR